MRILVQRQVRSADSVNLNPILRDRIPAETVILNSGKFRVPCVQQDDAARVRSDSIVDAAERLRQAILSIGKSTRELKRVKALGSRTAKPLHDRP